MAITNSLKKRFGEIENCEVHGRFSEVNVDDFKIALLHGDHIELLNSLINCGGFEAIAHGHSHAKVANRNGKTLIANPGEACGYLTGKANIDLLDTAKREARIEPL